MFHRYHSQWVLKAVTIFTLLLPLRESTNLFVQKLAVLWRQSRGRDCFYFHYFLFCSSWHECKLVMHAGGLRVASTWLTRITIACDYNSRDRWQEGKAVWLQTGACSTKWAKWEECVVTPLRGTLWTAWQRHESVNMPVFTVNSSSVQACQDSRHFVLTSSLEQRLALTSLEVLLQYFTIEKKNFFGGGSRIEEITHLWIKDKPVWCLVHHVLPDTVSELLHHVLFIWVHNCGWIVVQQENEMTVDLKTSLII